MLFRIRWPQVLLVLEGVGFGQHTAAAVAKQVDLAQVQRHAHGFHVVGHVLDGVFGYILQALGLPGAALVNEDQPVGARQRQQPRQEVGVVGAWAAMQDHQRLRPGRIRRSR